MNKLIREKAIKIKEMEELRELILAETPESIWYNGQDNLWYVDTGWLGRDVGSLFEGEDVFECLEKMHKYLLEHMDDDDTEGMIITKSGYPDLAKVRIYLKNKREEEEFIENMIEEKDLNLVEILKDAPKGTKLYSPIFGECELDEVSKNFIYVVVNRGNDKGYLKESFNSNGLYYCNGEECMLFPSKDNRDWNTFKIEEEGSFKVGVHVEEKDSNNRIKTETKMSEKLKGMYGSRARFDEVLEWLKSQGAEECEFGGHSESSIYYVDDGEVKMVDEIHSILFDIVELPRRWRAKYDEEYYFVSDRGETCCSSDIREALDNDRYNLGNYFKTPEEAGVVAKKVREIFKEK